MAPPSRHQTLFSDLGVAAAVLQWGRKEGDKKAGPVDASQFFPSTEIIFEVVVVERESSICMAAFFLSSFVCILQPPQSRKYQLEWDADVVDRVARLLVVR